MIAIGIYLAVAQKSDLGGALAVVSSLAGAIFIVTECATKKEHHEHDEELLSEQYIDPASLEIQTGRKQIFNSATLAAEASMRSWLRERLEDCKDERSDRIVGSADLKDIEILQLAIPYSKTTYHEKEAARRILGISSSSIDEDDIKSIEDLVSACRGANA